MLSEENSSSNSYFSKLRYALKYLETVPQLQPILHNLPKGLSFEFSEKITDAPAAFYFKENKILINPAKVGFKTPRDRLDFYLYLAHELCHANQQQEGLQPNDLKNTIFKDTFRVAKMMEVEARLVSTIVENELLKRKEFSQCEQSLDLVYYKQKLQENKDDMAGANADFIVAYWQDGIYDTAASRSVRDNINYFYFFYMEQAYHNAYRLHNPKYLEVMSEQNTPLQAMEKYLARMQIKDLDPNVFLQDKLDFVVATDDYMKGITVIQPNEQPFFNLCPTYYNTHDKLTYYDANGQPQKAFLKDIKTKELRPLPVMPSTQPCTVGKHKVQPPTKQQSYCRG